MIQCTGQILERKIFFLVRIYICSKNCFNEYHVFKLDKLKLIDIYYSKSKIIWKLKYCVLIFYSMGEILVPPNLIASPSFTSWTRTSTMWGIQKTKPGPCWKEFILQVLPLNEPAEIFHHIILKWFGKQL